MEGNGYNPMKIELEKLIEENKQLKKRAEEAEGENTIIKGIGNTSPEMKALRKENEELRKEMDELKADNKKLAKEINDRVDRLRKAGLV